jgi:hypothetical protein
MTDLSLLYGAEDNMSSNQIDNSDNMYSSQISGQQLHKLALQNDMNNDNYSQNNQQHQHSQQQQMPPQIPPQIPPQMPPQQTSQQLQPQQNTIRQQMIEDQKNKLMEQQNNINYQNYQPQQNLQYQNNKNLRTTGDYNFIDRMNLKKAEVAKLALFSFVIVLGISIDRIITFYISKYIGDNVLTDIQEFLLRLSYPIAIFLLLWIFKAI